MSLVQSGSVQSGSDGFPDTKDVNLIFSNVESLLVLSEQLHAMLLEAIGDKASNWTPQRKLGNIFVTLGPYFVSTQASNPHHFKLITQDTF